MSTPPPADVVALPLGAPRQHERVAPVAVDVHVPRVELEQAQVYAAPPPPAPGDELPGDIDILVGGGGQDSGQDRIKEDLVKVGPTLKAWAADGVPGWSGRSGSRSRPPPRSPWCPSAP